eukprot:gene18572-20434_t
MVLDLHLMEKNLCEVVFVPANMTRHLQPLDLAGNGCNPLSVKYREVYRFVLVRLLMVNSVLVAVSVFLGLSCQLIENVVSRKQQIFYQTIVQKIMRVQRLYFLTWLSARLKSTCYPEGVTMSLELMTPLLQQLNQRTLSSIDSPIYQFQPYGA